MVVVSARGRNDLQDKHISTILTFLAKDEYCRLNFVAQRFGIDDIYQDHYRDQLNQAAGRNSGLRKNHATPYDHEVIVSPTLHRCLLALSVVSSDGLATTGMRLDEVALLDWTQVKTQGEITYLDLTQAKVKTQGSERLVPLHSDLILPAPGSGRIFSYPVDRDGKAENKASKALMPYIRAVVGKDTRLVIHSFRHTIKDLLRDAGIEKEMNDFITGHSSGDTSGDYGRGPSLANRSIAIDKIDISFIFQTADSPTL